MTRPKKKSELPRCAVFAGKDGVLIEWTDSGKERVATRLTKALKWLGYEAECQRISPNTTFHMSLPRCAAEEPHRHCQIGTNAPWQEVAKLAGEHFLQVDIDTQALTAPEPKILGTALALLDLPEDELTGSAK